MQRIREDPAGHSGVGDKSIRYACITDARRAYVTHAFLMYLLPSEADLGIASSLHQLVPPSTSTQIWVAAGLGTPSTSAPSTSTHALLMYLLPSEADLGTRALETRAYVTHALLMPEEHALRMHC